MTTTTKSTNLTNPLRRGKYEGVSAFAKHVRYRVEGFQERGYVVTTVRMDGDDVDPTTAEQAINSRNPDKVLIRGYRA